MCGVRGATVGPLGRGGTRVGDSGKGVGVTAGSLGVVVDERFNVLAEFGPCLGGMVDLLISLSEAAVGCERRVAEDDDDGIFDGVVGGAMVHRAVGWVLELPGCLGRFVGLDVGGEVRAGGVLWRSWYVRAKGYWLHDWVVGGVSD